MAKIKPTARYVGSVDAARKLGVSRSTIHKAVKTGALVPDMRTPHGHARFTPETLETYREEMAAETLGELAREPVAQGSVRQAQLQAAMVQLLTSTSEVPEGCKAALVLIRQLVPSVHMCHVALSAPTDADLWAVRILAHDGYSAEAAATYHEIGHSVGPFTTEEVVRTGRAVRIETSGRFARDLLPGTALFLRQLDVQSFLALPLTAGGETIGALVVLSRWSRAWNQPDVELLRALAAQLGAMVWAAERLSKRRRMLVGGRDLVLTALALKGTAPVGTVRARLAETYCQASDAQGVCLLGTEHDLLIGDERLRGLAMQGQQDGGPKLTFLDVETHVRTVLASSLELSDGKRVGLAAIWPGRRSDVEAQHKLLTIFGGACVLVP